MNKRVTIDPVTRIEGHLRVDVEVDGGRVKKAWASGQMWRGVENILIGRDPRDAWAITQRICGVCTTVHAIASVRAVENALQLPVLPLLKVGDVVDGLEVLALVADNGIHRLYQVRDPLTQQRYALKSLHPQRAHDPEERQTLAHEAWVARRMQGGSAAGHLARLHDWPAQGAAAASGFYLLYDWYDGETLGALLQRQAVLPLAQVLNLVTQALRTVAVLHRQGVVHRDVKPDNLHLGEDGVLRLLDLGVALSGREPAATRELHAGTPSYMNPEQWAGHGQAGHQAQLPDAGSDLYALGVTLYQLLSLGRLPYGEVLPYQSGRYHRDPQPPSRHNPQVPIWLDHVALKAVARQRAQRFETAEEMLLALERGASRPLSAPVATPLILRSIAELPSLGRWKFSLQFAGAPTSVTGSFSSSLKSMK